MSTYVTNIFTQAYLSYKGLFLWLNWHAYISNVFIRPVLFVAMFALLGRFAGDREAAEAYLIGMAAYSIPWILLGGLLQSFHYERAFGTLSFVFGSRGSRLINYFSRAGFHYPNAIISITASILFAWLFLNLNVGSVDWLAASCAVLLIAASCATLALFLGTFAIVFQDWFNTLAIASGLLLTLTGVIIPTAVMPGILGDVGRILPLTHGLAAFREAFDGAGVTSVGADLLRELFVGLGYAVAGYTLFRLLEAQAKRRGTLELAG